MEVGRRNFLGLNTRADMLDQTAVTVVPLPSGPLSELATRCNRSWPTIFGAASAAQRVRADLAHRVVAGTPPLIPADTTLIVFGSLARGEWTHKSDLDWTLLVDGEVDGSHADAAREIRKAAEELQLQEPGPTGLFGRLTFSHDLVHLIGGEDDTNTNTSRRMLLVLESVAIGEDPVRSVRSRVLRALLDRYVGEDLFYHAPRSYLVPRFLLNDVSRYWRTITVDSAQKRRDRAEKWASSPRDSGGA